MVLALLVVAFAAVLGWAMLASSQLQAQVAGNLSQSAKAECLAVSGIELAIYYLQNPSKAPSLNADGYWSGGNTLSVGSPDGAADVTVASQAGKPGQFKITSTGRVTKPASSSAFRKSSALVQFPSAQNVYGAAALGSISIGSGNVVDSFDSRNGPYVVGNSKATMASNGNITLNNSAVIQGDAFPGPGMTVSGGTVTGSRTPLSTPLSLPAVNPGNYANSNDNALAGANIVNGDLNIPSGQTSNIPGGVYFVQDFYVAGNSQLNTNGYVVVYVTGSVSIAGKVKTLFDNPANLTVMIVGSGSVSLSGQANYYMSVYAPKSSVSLSGNANMFGKIVANTLTLTAQAPSGFHVDEALITVNTNQAGGPARILSYSP